jgi:predicted kinase
MELVLFVGLQASGKSTFFVERFLRSHVHLSLDVLKTRHREKRRQFLPRGPIRPLPRREVEPFG